MKLFIIILLNCIFKSSLSLFLLLFFFSFFLISSFLPFPGRKSVQIFTSLSFPRPLLLIDYVSPSLSIYLLLLSLSISICFLRWFSVYKVSQKQRIAKSELRSYVYRFNSENSQELQNYFTLEVEIFSQIKRSKLMKRNFSLFYNYFILTKTQF